MKMIRKLQNTIPTVVEMMKMVEYLDSWLVMLSTENWEMLSQLLVWTSGSWEEQVRDAKHGFSSCPLLICHYLWHVALPLHSRLLPKPPWFHTIMAFLSYGSHSDVLKV